MEELLLVNIEKEIENAEALANQATNNAVAKNKIPNMVPAIEEENISNGQDYDELVG